MTGDENDFRKRLRLTLPTRWFGEVAPVLDALLIGLGAGWATLYQLLQFVIQQTRVRTATDGFLELCAQDYLSSSFPRRGSEYDDAYRLRLLDAMQRACATKPAVIAAAAAAGYSVTVFEPTQPADTGAYNVPRGLAWNTVGAWGSLQMPFESLVVARPGQQSFESELWRNVAGATPAGGAVWLRISSPDPA